MDALAQRDVRDLARIGALNAMSRLLKIVAGQTSRLLNVADLASPFQLGRPTISDDVTLLERVFEAASADGFALGYRAVSRVRR